MQWTNKSVLNFAAGDDPIRAVEERAKQLIRKAKDSGWDGPPYNPVKIADMLNVPVRANGGIADARTLPIADGVVIEYNPTHSRERVRFSLAHEIAHLLFDDHHEKIRNRNGETQGDDWQLEMLCNIAAAEFVMPVGSFPDPENIPDIEQLMLNRRELDVSAEAYLIRFAKSAKVPVTMFRASPYNDGQERQYRVDYVVTNGATEAPSNVSIPADSRIRECSAIGLTAKFEEVWIGSETSSIHAVGIPNSPGSLYPRVAGLIRSNIKSETQLSIVYVHRNIQYPTGEGRKIICQLVNNKARTWGGGVARQHATKYPLAHAVFKDWISGIKFEERLGKVHIADAGDGNSIASIIRTGRVR